ncbi:MAG: outer membrane protein assembly factor BamA [Bacteroidales bacterium]|nr:outer membrane protein assembly factor BamA [Bacteroidales bacterium]
MKLSKLIFSVMALALPLFAAAQQTGFEVDYNNPRKFILGDITVEGNHYFSAQQIIQQTGLRKGMEVGVPSDDLNAVVDRLYLQRYFEDIALKVDSLSSNRDSIYLKVVLKERPRVSRWTFSGIRKSEQTDLQERLNFRRGGEFSDYVAQTSTDIIKRYFSEKGFLNADVQIETQEDTVIQNAVRVNYAINKGTRVRIKDINFYGNEDVKEYKLAKSMKKTKSNKWYNFFHSKKFNEKEYPNDKEGLVSAFNEAGFRDARILKDSIYYIEPNKLGIDFYIDQGQKYYFRDITWTGNSVYSADQLNQILNINKGDIYDIVTLEKRLFGGGKESDYDVSKLYRDNGYLFFNITPVELNIQGDSIDVELRITEGKPATLNNIVINGNDLTNERVVRRQIYTRPGYLFTQTQFERSIREIASLGQFDPEAIMDPNKGYSVVPNALNNTVDLVYNVTEKPSSQLELSGGWGGRTFVGSLGVSFNNFSTRRMFEKGAWRPVPLGDAQTLSLRFQTNGTYYTALTASFMEPWLFGKKPTSLSLSAYYTRQTNSYLAWNILNNDRQMEVFGFAGGIGTRLKWPDDYFVLYNGLSWQTYRLANWYSGSFIFDSGISHNLSYSINLSRTSTDQQIYPRQGSEFVASLQLTPPYSLLRKNADAIDYESQTAQQRYKWVEYHKWKFSGTVYAKLVGDLVLMSRAQFGYLGYYSRNLGYSPFEGFLVGGDGMSGYNTYGSEVISLRGYENYSLTPYLPSKYNSSGYAYAGNVYDKFTVELRYPVILQPQSTIFALLFLEGGNCWADIRDFRPFQIKRSAGVGVRVFLPMVGLLGVDWGWGFDDQQYGRSQFHFVIGQQF